MLQTKIVLQIYTLQKSSLKWNYDRVKIHFDIKSSFILFIHSSLFFKSSTHSNTFRHPPTIPWLKWMFMYHQHMICRFKVGQYSNTAKNCGRMQDFTREELKRTLTVTLLVNLGWGDLKGVRPNTSKVWMAAASQETPWWTSHRSTATPVDCWLKPNK